jgi:hypothetical protein
MTDTPLLHVYGQDYQHAPLVVVANREGLLALRAAVDRALHAPLDADLWTMVGSPEPGPMTKDGEHYDVVILRDDSPWLGTKWQGYGFPYHAIDYLDCSAPPLPAYPIRERNADR